MEKLTGAIVQGDGKAMKCEIRIARKEEIDLLVDLRLRFVTDLHPEYDRNKVRELTVATKAYLEGLFARDAYVGFVGEVGGELACTAGLLIYDYPPLYSKDFRKIGHVLNFFTIKKFRRNGFGIKLMEFIKDYAKRNSFHKLDLTATEDGYGLYRKCGYTDSVRNMELAL